MSIMMLRKCTACGAAPGEPCRDEAGSRMTFMHSQRQTGMRPPPPPRSGNGIAGRSDGMLTDQMRVVFGLVAAVGVVIGSLLPWVSVNILFGSVSLSGTDGDGKITLVVGIIGAIIAFGVASVGARVAAGIAFAICAIVGFVDIVRVMNGAAGLGSSDGLALGDAVRVSVGSGLWLMTAASVAGVVAMMLTRKSMAS
jgi:hypothetical protein